MSPSSYGMYCGYLPKHIIRLYLLMEVWGLEYVPSTIGICDSVVYRWGGMIWIMGIILIPTALGQSRDMQILAYFKKILKII
jgi:hypothetical protein